MSKQIIFAGCRVLNQMYSVVSSIFLSGSISWKYFWNLRFPVLGECVTYCLFAPRAANGNNFFAVKCKFLLKSLLVVRDSVSLQELLK